MPPTPRSVPNKRNKVLHRFYEPLVLLYVLDKIQGNQIARRRDETSSERISKTELRKRFLDSLAYMCDSEKGGDTTTAIFVSSPPLTYHVACNKNFSPENQTTTFLSSVLELARGVKRDNTVARERQILEECAAFSKKRIFTYRQFLGQALDKCMEISSNNELQVPVEKITLRFMSSRSLADLCLCCFNLMKSPELLSIQDKAVASEDLGNVQSPYAQARHFIGRLAHHVQVVKVLLAAAVRLPDLFEDFTICPVNSEPVRALPPPSRNKLTLPGITNRLISGNDDLRRDIENRLQELDIALQIEDRIRNEYGEKNLKPRVHAEIKLVDYFYRNRNELNFVDNDRYIAASKPACFCCYLYIYHHPGNFVPPATHQKIYLNWLPPTSCTTEVLDPNSDVAKYELSMINQMVKAIRSRAIEEIKSKTAGQRRKYHFDSVTWETLPNHGYSVITEARPDLRSNSSRKIDVATTIDGEAEELFSRFDSSINIGDESDDPDLSGGVVLDRG